LTLAIKTTKLLTASKYRPIEVNTEDIYNCPNIYLNTFSFYGIFNNVYKLIKYISNFKSHGKLKSMNIQYDVLCLAYLNFTV
jgi:hypothetical protein